MLDYHHNAPGDDVDSQYNCQLSSLALHQQSHASSSFFEQVLIDCCRDNHQPELTTLNDPLLVLVQADFETLDDPFGIAGYLADPIDQHEDHHHHLAVLKPAGSAQQHILNVNSACPCCNCTK